MVLVVSPLVEIEVALQRSAQASLAKIASALMGTSLNEAFDFRAYRTTVAVVFGRPIFPTMMGPIGTIAAAFGHFTGTGGSLALTVATKLVTADGNIASVDVYITSLAAFSGLCAALMCRDRSARSMTAPAMGVAADVQAQSGDKASESRYSRYRSPQRAPDRARAVREISQTAVGLDNTSQGFRRRL